MNSDEVMTGQQLQGLQGLPEELLDAVLRQLDASSRLQVFRTSKLLATALLQRFPRIKLTYPTQHDILGQHLRELAPFLTEVLQNRQHPKLHLTLRPEFGLLLDIRKRHKVEPAAAASDAARLKLTLSGRVEVDGEREFLSGLLPFPPTLTQLAVTHGPGPMALLPALAHLPSLHTLVMEGYVEGQQQLHALLARTQITHLELYGFRGLTSSRASADCSWRRLKVWRLDWVSAAYLPLHSLTHPLRLRQLVKDTGEPSVEVLAAAELNLCVHNKAGLVLDKGMYLSNATVNLLTEQYLSHSHRTAQQPTHPTVASSSHSGPSTSLASSSISAGQRGHQWGVTAAGGQALMQRLGPQKEIVMYAYFKRLDYFSTECVYAPFAARGFARDFIKDLEAARPSAILDLTRSTDHFAVSLAAQRSPGPAASPGTSLPTAPAAASLAPLHPATSSAASKQPCQVQCLSSRAAVVVGRRGPGPAGSPAGSLTSSAWVVLPPGSFNLSRQPLRPLSVSQQVAAPGAAPSPPPAGLEHSPQAPSPGVAPSPGQRPTTAVALDIEALQQAGGSQAAGSGRVGQVGGARQRGMTIVYQP
ncbi:hypothetical protein QJQ45_010691 [Haematococcus lacustris]|nr:hypothetical protein QJQ45_010691 [Haematococcus lacustris]